VKEKEILVPERIERKTVFSPFVFLSFYSFGHPSFSLSWSSIRKMVSFAGLFFPWPVLCFLHKEKENKRPKVKNNKPSEERNHFSPPCLCVLLFRASSFSLFRLIFLLKEANGKRK